MASVIKLKRSATSGAVPGSLQEGEIAVNLFDRKIYVGNSAGVTAIGGVSGFAADILTELKTVDGPSSGLDADLLDGQHGAYYAVAATENSRLANTNTYIATKLDTSTAASTYSTLVQLANTNSYIATKLDSSSYTASDVLTKIKTVDGAASGLDADLLDGQQGSYYAVEATEKLRLANTNSYIATKLDSSSYTTADVRSKAALANTNAYIATKLDSSSYTTADVRSKAALANTNAYIASVSATERSALANTNAYIATKLNSSSYTASDVLTKIKTVDGAASGLDADLLDGQHGSYYAVAATEASRLANTNSYIANVKTIAVNRLGQTATVALTGDVTASATAFSSNAASISTTIAANSVDGSKLTDNITIASNLTVSGNTHIDGNLTVEGATTYLSTSTVYTDDGMMKLNANNAADTIDSGVYNLYIESLTSKYAGYFRDATDGVFKFYDGLQAEPSTTVNTAGTGYALAQVDAIIDGGTY